MEKIIIERDHKLRKQVLIFTPLAIIVTSKSAFQNLVQEDAESWRLYFGWFMAIFVILMIIAVVNTVRKLLLKGPAITIDDSGFTDNVSMANAGLIPWGDIRSYEVKKSGGRPHVFLFVDDPEKYITEAKGFRKGMLRQLYKDKNSPIAINLSDINISQMEVMKILEERIARIRS